MVDPSLYRILNEVIQTIPGSRIEIVTQIVTKQGDVNLEKELVVTDQTLFNDAETPLTLLGGLSISNQNKDRGDDVLDNNSDDDNGVHTTTNTNGDNDDDDDDDDEEEEDLMVNRRKQQKKAKKKNQKAKRRGDGGDGRDLGSFKNHTGTSHQNTNVLPTPTPTPTQVSQPNSSSSTLTDRNDSNGSTDTRKSCNTCGGFFDTAAAYRSHFKSDWHRFNQKLKLKGVPPVSEQEFLACDSDTFFGSESDLM